MFSLHLESMSNAQSIEQFINETTPSSGRFAYAFIVGGCDETSCKKYVLNALASVQALKHFNSTADVHFKVRMSANVTDSRLPPDQEKWLTSAGVNLQYLPKLSVDNLGTITLEKFRVLEMTDYDRVWIPT